MLGLCDHYVFLSFMFVFVYSWRGAVIEPVQTTGPTPNKAPEATKPPAQEVVDQKEPGIIYVRYKITIYSRACASRVCSAVIELAVPACFASV